MQKHTDKTPIKRLRDAYKVPGFRVLARIDSYEHEPPAVVITLDRRSKKPFAADVGKRAAAATTSAGDGRVILAAGGVTFTSIFRCTASVARPAA